MQVEQIVRYLDDGGEAASWLKSLGIVDTRRGHDNLVGLAQCGIPLDLLAVIAEQLSETLPTVGGADRALNSLQRFVKAARNPLSLSALFEREKSALPILLQIFAASEYLGDILVRDPESYDLLRLTEGQPSHAQTLIDELCAEVAPLREAPLVMSELRRFKHRETLRIAYGDIIRGQSLETVTRQISHLADAVTEAALRHAWKTLAEKWGSPQRPDGKPARFVVLALGKHGGEELNYSSDIDLMFLYDEDGKTSGQKHCENGEFFDRLARDIRKLLSEVTPLGHAYRVDLRLRPEGSTGPLVLSRAAALHYYDTYGRTWERQAFVKSRASAGDTSFGKAFLQDLKPWVWRRYLTQADISGIKTLKRKIERRTEREGGDLLDVKTGHGGIRDVEFCVQFLQLLNGGDLESIRCGNTLDALRELADAGCLTQQEAVLLAGNYRFLRRIEHRLQIMLDVQTHRLPDDPAEESALAQRLGYSPRSPEMAREEFRKEYRRITQSNRQVLNHLLHDAFDEETPEPEVDLVLDPEPASDRVAHILESHGFHNPFEAHRNLQSLGEERVRFLSTRRSRHFLASIAPRMLREIGRTPNPDLTLVNLSQVSDSLGGKAALWELFSFSPPTLNLYVKLCSSSPFLCGLLTSNPGMIDELLDSLLLDRLPTLPTLTKQLNELLKGAVDPEPILHSFKNTQTLFVGVREILGKDDIEATTAALSHIAESCLRQIARMEYDKLVEKLGRPTIVSESGPRPCNFALVGMGKFGGQELNYHSDLDLIFLYEDDGDTKAQKSSQRDRVTTNQHFYSELSQRIIKACTHLGPYGRLYEVDARLRPSGRSGMLTTSLEGFRNYFREGQAQLWERQALCKARVVLAAPEGVFTAAASEALQAAAFTPPWQEAFAEEIRSMRRRLELTVSSRDIKRGKGGLVDVEFIAQLLQLKHGGKSISLRTPNTLKALRAAMHAGVLEPKPTQDLVDGYRFLREIESRLRLMNSTARDELPSEADELRQLAYFLGKPSGDELIEAVANATRSIRALFAAIVDENAGVIPSDVSG